MKLSLFFLSALLSGASAQQLRQENRELSHSRRLELQAMEPRELIEQDECKKITGVWMKEMVDLVRNGEKPVTNFLCNKIGRKDSKKAIKMMKKEIKGGRHLAPDADAVTICERGIDRLLTSGPPEKDGVKKATKNMGSCKKEMAKELGALLKLPELQDRRLLELMDMDEENEFVEGDDNHRELWGSFFRKVLPVVKKVAVPIAKNVATQAWNRARPYIPRIVKKLNPFSWSDRRLKQNIQMIGSSPSGIPVYTYQYKSSADGVDTKATYSGVMAQDLLASDHAEAVTIESNGFYKVDYSKIDVEAHKLN